MRISGLEVENVMRVRLVHLALDGKQVVRIEGPNNAGKTSVLNAIAMALGGKDLCPAEPLRRGEKKGRVQVTLTEGLQGLVAERRWWRSGTETRTELEVRALDGTPLSKPQQILDALIGKLTFDPLAFTRLKPKEQAEQLRRLVGLDFSTLDAKRLKAYEARRGANAQVTQIEARLRAVPEVEAPDEPVSTAALLEESQALQKQKAANDMERAALQRAKDVFAARKREAEQAAAEVSRARAALERAEEASRAADEALEEARAAGKALAAKVEGLVDPDLTALAAKMRDVEGVNEKVRARKQRKALAAELAQAEAAAKKLSDEIDGIDEQKAKALAEAAFPVDGLSFNDAGVLLNGLPIEQASASEQLRVSLAIGMAANPKLRVMTIRDASLLDAKSMKLVEEVAAKHDFQVLLEIVSDGGGTGIVISDGVVADPAPAEAA
jgi:DNA repair exonuclease SbcCD ATPase subunit